MRRASSASVIDAISFGPARGSGARPGRGRRASVASLGEAHHRAVGEVDVDPVLAGSRAAPPQRRGARHASRSRPGRRRAYASSAASGSSSFCVFRRAPAAAFFAGSAARRRAAGTSSGRRRRGRPWARAPVTATTRRSPSPTTKTQPSWKATYSWVGSPAGPAAPLRSARALVRDRARRARRLVSVDASTAPSPSRKHRGLDLRGDLDEVGERLRGVHGAANLTHDRRLPRRASSPPQVPRRPRHAPGRDDRLLRDPRVRPAPLPGALARRLRGRAGRVQLPDRGDPAGVPGELGREHPRRASPRSRSRRPSSPSSARVGLLWAALGFFSVARVRVQHRLRPPEPAVHPPEERSCSC